MSKAYDYGLDWLDQKELYEITKNAFGFERQPSKVPLDPFTAIFQASVAETGLAGALAFEELRKINKTISNNVGDWHQKVLGLAKNWTTAPRGGVIDLESVGQYRHPEFGKPVIVEVKNRYNTIKGSDEKNIWDTLEKLARAQDKIAYVFQIVPKAGERFDREWKVSGRETRPYVRHCDGRTAYALVFERENALEEIFSALPAVLEDIRGVNIDFDPEEIAALFDKGFKDFS